MNKIAALLSLLLLTSVASAALAAGTPTSGLQDGGFVQPTDYFAVARSGCTTSGDCKVHVGSAAAVNIGTSGATLGLLNTGNTYSALQSFLSGDLTAADPVFTGGAVTLPIGTTGARPGSPVNGMIRYNSTTPGFEGYVNNAWGPIGSGGGGGLTVGSTTITSGTTTKVLFDNAGVLGEYTISGTASVAMTNSPIFVTPNLGVPSAVTLTNGTGLPISTGVSGLGTGVATLLGGSSSGTGGPMGTISPTTTGTLNGAAAIWSAADTALNFTATGTGANQLPAGTTAQRPTAANGMIRYNSDATPTVEVYVNGAWESFGLVPNRTVTLGTTIAATDMGGQVNFNGSSITATIPAVSTTIFPANTSAIIVNQNATALTLSSTPAINGITGTALGKYGWLNLTANSLGTLDAFGFPGFGTITSNALQKFSGTGGISTASGLLDNGTSITTAETLDLSSSTNSMVLPSGTSGQRPSPANGMLRYNSTVPQVEAYYSGSWNALGAASAGITLTTTGSSGASTLVGTVLNIPVYSGGGGGAAPQILSPSIYTADTSGSLFPYIYTGAGGNASASEAGWAVAASLGADVVLQMRFQMPSVLPSGTFKLVSYCLANASSGVAKYTVSDADVGTSTAPSAATLTAETQTSITWAAADKYVITKTTLTSTPIVDDVSVVAVTFNHTGWTLAALMSCRWVELWE